jgi:bifunctional UDP-N-acetylglucosamine pyrophosphorylase/glucosamine-1-phosphate N-acetyltransferase
MTDLAVVLLAAGHGTRMRSKKQKVLHEVGGKPMILHVFEAASAVATRKPVIVVGPGENGIQQLIGGEADYIEQAERLGTGHAVQMAAPLLQDGEGQVLVTYGDMPLLRRETLSLLARRQAESDAEVALLSVIGEPDSSFGRIVRNAREEVCDIMEVAEAKRRPNAAELLAIRELNVGVYCFAAAWLWDNLLRLPLRQARTGPEYYLTDMIPMAVQQSRRVEAIITNDPDEAIGAGTRAELAVVEKAFRRRANKKWLEAGVTLIDPESTYIDQDVQIGQDTVVWPNTFIQGASLIGENCVLGPNTIIRDANVGPGCHIEQAVIIRVSLSPQTRVPPFTLLEGNPL